MAERYLTFAEVEQRLGLSTDEVRELMESKALRGEIVDGVIQFRESEVKRLKGKSPGPGGEKDDKDAGLLFLVDEDEEKRIEGKAYDGEELLAPRPAAGPAPDEEIIEPVGLSEEQLRNSAVLGTDEVVEFGREVAERSGRGELTPAEISEGEEILDASKVQLPEPDFGKLASAFDEARREEPPEAPREVEPPALEKPVERPVEPEAERPLEELIRPTLEPSEARPVESTPVEEEIPSSAREEAVEPAGVGAVPAEAPAAPESETGAVEFNVDGEPEPVMPASPEKELTFAEEATGPMMCPVPPSTEEPRTEGATSAETPVVEQATPATPEAVAPVEEEVKPVLPEAVEAPAEQAAAESVAAETKSEGPVPEATGREAAPEEESARTFEAALPLPTTPVTESFERAVDEEVEDRGAEPEAASKLEELFAAEGAGVKETPVEPERQESAGVEKPAAADRREPEPIVPAEEAQEEVRQVSEERKEKEEETPKPPEEGAKPEEEVVPENIEVFDLEAPAEGTGAGEEGLVTLEEEAPAAEAPGAESSKEKSLEEEMAELFGEEKPGTPVETPAAPEAPTEDFDLSVFKKEEGVEEAMPVAEESLFEVDEQGATAEPLGRGSLGEVESAGRLGALLEEQRAPSNALFTVVALFAFVVLAFTGMLLWHVFVASQ